MLKYAGTHVALVWPPIPRRQNMILEGSNLVNCEIICGWNALLRIHVSASRHLVFFERFFWGLKAVFFMDLKLCIYLVITSDL
jgi:hypothetical protein